MKPLKILALLLGISGFQVAAQNATIFTLDQVNTQMSAFLQGVQNETLEARPLLSSGCSLTVRNCYISADTLLTNSVRFPRFCSTRQGLIPQQLDLQYWIHILVTPAGKCLSSLSTFPYPCYGRFFRLAFPPCCQLQIRSQEWWPCGFLRSFEHWWRGYNWYEELEHDLSRCCRCWDPSRTR